MKKTRFWLGAALGVPFLLLSTLAWAELKGQFGLFFPGGKFMDLDVASEADRVEKQAEIGFSLSFGDVDWPVMLAVDVMTSGSDDDFLADSYSFDYAGPYFNYTVTYNYFLDYDVDTTEVNLGVRKFWREEKRFAPYVGGGLAFVTLDATSKLLTEVDVEGIAVPGASASLELVDDSDTAVGYWVNGGLQWRMWRGSGSLLLGVDVRYSDAEAELDTGQGGFNLTGVIDEDEVDAGGLHAGITFGYHW